MSNPLTQALHDTAGQGGQGPRTCPRSWRTLQDDVDALVEHADGFAEVFPEHKFEIVATSSRAAATLWA